MNRNTLISDLTVGELVEVITATIRKESARKTERVYGINGIAQLFGVSYSKAKEIKASGMIDKAITQQGRVIITDAELALRLWRGC